MYIYTVYSLLGNMQRLSTQSWLYTVVLYTPYSASIQYTVQRLNSEIFHGCDAAISYIYNVTK